MVNFALYADDSGTSPSQRVAIATGLIIPASQLRRLESEWNAFLRKEGFKSLHTSECVARNTKSDFAGWDDAKVERVLKRVRQISMKYGCCAISAAVNKADYDDAMPDEFRKYFGKHHYTWCISHVIAYAERSEIQLPFGYIFDWMGRANDDRRREVERVMDYCEKVATEQGYRNDYTNYSFQHRERVVGLQCVDAVAWTCYQFALSKIHGTPLSKFAESGWSDYGGHRADRGWLRAFTFTKSALRKWAEAETKDGRAMKRFLEWEKMGGKRYK